VTQPTCMYTLSHNYANKFRHTCTYSVGFSVFSLIGVYFPASRHYYYTNNRYQTRFPPQSKDIVTKIELLKEIEEEERVTIREQRSKECGYTGLSILHRLWPLYGFRYDKDLVFDEMHTVQLNVVKEALGHLLSDEDHPVDWCEVDRRLEQLPWTPGIYLKLTEASSINSFIFPFMASAWEQISRS